MRFKGERVWVRADDIGKAGSSDGSGRAEMKYRETDNKSYRPFAGNLSPDDGRGRGAGRRQTLAAARVSESAAVPKAAATTAPRRAHRGQGAGAVDRRRVLGESGADGDRRRRRSTAASGASMSEYLGVGTNNIAELTAIERALDTGGRRRRQRRGAVRIYTDSAYSIGVLSKGWKAKANQELIARMRRRLAELARTSSS